MSFLCSCRSTPDYRAQLLENFHTLYPALPTLRIVTTPGCVYIMSTIDGERQVIVHRQTYHRVLPGGEERAIRQIWGLTDREVRRLEERRRVLEKRRRRAQRAWGAGSLEKEVGK